jgi:hypothetical protein
MSLLGGCLCCRSQQQRPARRAAARRPLTPPPTCHTPPQLEIERGELKTGVGAVQQKEFNIQRRIQIAYLDETLRIARFLPSEELADDEAGEQRSEEEIIFVFKRQEPSGVGRGLQEM